MRFISLKSVQKPINFLLKDNMKLDNLNVNTINCWIRTM